MSTAPTSRAAIVLALVFLATAGCEAATNAANGAGNAIQKTAEKIGEKTNDAAIVVAVKGSLFNADKAFNKVSVGCLDGVVSLAGTVPTADQKAKAEQIAMQAKGVTKVLNSIDVAPAQ